MSQFDKAHEYALYGECNIVRLQTTCVVGRVSNLPPQDLLKDVVGM